ncbi:MAG TPA: hypothetical protein VNU20_05785 [Candidatus Sulfotelmatobacter sp.]|jgi:hypothetical protein|nr:hypothetical protein [Candidatus Sulfotelmatobacter sp.]
MNDFSPLPIKDWYALGSLIAEIGFLVAAVWFARSFLRTMRAFQEQIGALLKLSITSTPGERQSTNTTARSALAEGSPYWLPPSPSTSVDARANPPEEFERGPNLFVAGWQRLVHWLREPMGGSRVSYRRRMMNWLQAPVGH